MIVAIVPARKNSVGILDKNIQTINGQTLLELAINFGKSCNAIDEVIVSTDSREYENIAVSAGARSFGLRRGSLSTRDVTTAEVVHDLLLHPECAKIDCGVLLQPSSPIRRQDEVKRAIDLSIETGESVVSLSRVEEPHPEKLFTLDGCKVTPYLQSASAEVPRQKLPSVYRLTGAFYVFHRHTVLERRSLFSINSMGLEQDHFINIDSPVDLALARLLLGDYDNAATSL